MGGNIVIEGTSSVPIQIRNIDDRTFWMADINEAVSIIAGPAPVYLGSARNLMDESIPTDELIRFKPEFGDVDVYMPRRDFVVKPGDEIGQFVVIGAKKHGIDTTVLMKHIGTGNVIQFDFVNSQYEPGATSFLHSSPWDDTVAGFKGLYHKILLNAIGLDKYKFSIAYGLRLRDNPDHSGWQYPQDVSAQLFGADFFNARSFVGLCKLLVVNPNEKEIIEKFKDSLSRVPGDHSKAIKYIEG